MYVCMYVLINYGIIQISTNVNYYKYKVYTSLIEVQSRNSSMV
jgi:hypothetical protein